MEGNSGKDEMKKQSCETKCGGSEMSAATAIDRAVYPTGIIAPQ
jgi:hypothetical protein